MDPSYNNSFGTPMPMGNNMPVGGNVPVGGGVPVGGNMPVGGSVPVGGNMPVGGNVPVGGNMVPTPSVTGDIVLSTEPKKKKTGIIVLLILVVLAIVTGVGYVIWTNVSGGGGGKTAPVGVKEAFNRYANYFVYGEESTEPIGAESFDAVEESYFEEQTKTLSAERVEYFDNTETYFKNFYDVYSKTLSDDQDQGKDVLAMLDDYGERLNLVADYYKGNDVTRPMVVEEYVSNGESSAKTLINDTLARYKDIGDIYGMNYYNVALERANEMLDLVKIYESNGCIKEGSLDYDCAFAIQGQEIDALKLSISDGYYDMMAIIRNSIYDLQSGIFSFDELINGTTGGDANEN